MTFQKRFDLNEDWLLCHGQQISRVITRMSTADAGDYTKLRAETRTLIIGGMSGEIEIDVPKLSADMAAYAARHSDRKLSLAATGGSNPDFYRNWKNDGQNKRLSAKVFMGIVSAIGRDPFEYVKGVQPELSLPNASVLMSTFAVLLESLDIDPIEDGRAQKLASSFPGALQRSLDLQAQILADRDSAREATAPARDEEPASA